MDIIKNNSILDRPESPDNPFIANSIIENYVNYLHSLSNIEGLLIIIILYAFVAFIGINSIFINQFIKIFNIENKEFVFKRPLLAKYIKFVLSTNNYINLFIIFLTWLAIVGVIIISLYL